MNPIEKAIRGALEKGDAGDRAYRETVYRTVHAALERTIAARADLSPEVATQRRQMLRATVRSIESEFIAAVAPVEAPEEVQSDAGRSDGAVEPPRVPRVDAPVPRDAGPVPSVAPDDVVPPSYDAPDVQAPLAERRGRGRLLALAFVGATLVAAVGIGIWWVADHGLFVPAEERDTAVRNPPLLLEDEEFDPEDRLAEPARPGDAAARGNWVSIFDPADLSVVTAPAGATAQVVDVDGAPALRIQSQTGDSPVIFDVGLGILEQVAGRNALFNVVARVGEGDTTQISVTCNFGELGGCGRNRYNVGQDRGDFLFEREMPDAAPGAAGAIAIVSDIQGNGSPVDIFEIRVSVDR